MTDTHVELLTIVDTLQGLAARGAEPEIQDPLQNLRRAAEEVGKAWSGSWMGYQANVYYRDLKPPPPGAHFNPEWGMMPSAFVPERTTGDWIEYDPEEVSSFIYKRAESPNMEALKEFDGLAGSEFLSQKSNLLSIIEIEIGNLNSQILTDQKEGVSKLSLIAEHQYLESWKPRSRTSRDSKAIYQGVWVPPHGRILAQVVSIQTTVDSIVSLTDIAKQVALHISRQHRQPVQRSVQGTRVFIGHGRSHIWRELKDFLEDRLGLLVDEFNRVSSAGIPTTGRQLAMLDSAGFAFLLMTGEDEQTDGQVRARENVVHEAGLFQGRLGFERAIILLEEGCEEFSNITGLGQIRFPKGKIEAAFEEIRQVLEREGVLTP